MLSRLVIAFLPRSKCLLISWVQSPSAVILEPKKIKSHYFHCFPIYFPWSDGTICHDLHFLNADNYTQFISLVSRCVCVCIYIGSFGLSISPSSEYLRLISFRTDWLNLFAVQGTLKSLLQCHSSEASIQLSLESQFSHPYMTTGKTMALTRQTFVGKVMSLLFNMLSRLVIVFLARSKCLLISWVQSPSAVILEPKKVKSVTISIVSPSICQAVMGPDAMILV